MGQQPQVAALSEEEIARSAVEAESNMPAFITGFQVVSREDLAGDLATWVDFYVDPKTPANMDTARILRALADSVQDRAQSMGALRFPFVRFE